MPEMQGVRTGLARTLRRVQQSGIVRHANGSRLPPNVQQAQAAGVSAMTPPLNIPALRALVAKATPGPWEQDDESTICSNDGMIAVPCEFFGVEQQDENIALIVAAVNALPALLDELDAARKDAERECWWARDGEDSDTWQTQCGHWFTVNDGTPSDNEMHYCPFCAGKIDDTPDDAAIAREGGE